MTGVYKGSRQRHSGEVIYAIFTELWVVPAGIQSPVGSTFIAKPLSLGSKEDKFQVVLG